MAIFLILFGCNFSLYYLILIGRTRDIFRSEEFKTYFVITTVAVGFVFLSLVGRFGAIPQVYTTEEAFRHPLFQVASLMTTAGGVKISRIVIAVKGSCINVRKLINPRYVPKAKFEGKTLETKTINDVFAFITLYVFIFLLPPCSCASTR